MGVIIFEPNRLNPMLFLMCLLDRNERRLLKMGNFRYYIKLLKDSFHINVITKDYNGLLIGPSSKIMLGMADMIERCFGGILRWLHPKLIIVAQDLSEIIT